MSPQTLPAVPLSSIAEGRTVRIQFVQTDRDGTRLRELGLREGSSVQVLRRDRGKLIVGIAEARFGVGTEVADRVFVESDGVESARVEREP